MRGPLHIRPDETPAVGPGGLAMGCYGAVNQLLLTSDHSPVYARLVLGQLSPAATRRARKAAAAEWLAENTDCGGVCRGAPIRGRLFISRCKYSRHVHRKFNRALRNRGSR